jgi:hypothetical protein
MISKISHQSEGTNICRYKISIGYKKYETLMHNKIITKRFIRILKAGFEEK